MTFQFTNKNIHKVSQMMNYVTSLANVFVHYDVDKYLGSLVLSYADLELKFPE